MKETTTTTKNNKNQVFEDLNSNSRKNDTDNIVNESLLKLNSMKLLDLDSTTRCENKVEGFKVTSCTKALSIYLILAHIFPHLKFEELMGVRLVCRLWNSMITDWMERNAKMRFYYKRDIQDYEVYKWSNGQFQSKKISLDQVLSTVGDTDLSCYSFEFISATLHDQYINVQLNTPSLLRFFESHGNFIKHFTLHLSYVNHSFSAERIFLNEMRKLLIHFVPNLETLSLKVHMSPSWKESDHSFLQYKFYMDPLPLVEIPPNFTHLVLKSVTIQEDTTQPFFEDILNFAPNLQEFDIERKFFYLFVEPSLSSKNPLRFLKTLSILPRAESLLNLDLIAFNSNLKLRKICINLPCQDSLQNGQYEWPLVLWNILARSKDSLEDLYWTRTVNWNKKLVPILPKVRQVTIATLLYDHVLGIFPFKIQMYNLFQKLESITLETSVIEPCFLDTSYKSIQFDEFTPMPWVKYLYLSPMEHVPIPGITTKQIEQLSSFFPNASVWQKKDYSAAQYSKIHCN